MQTSKNMTDRRIIRSKEALKQALLSLLSQKSFSSISITEIVELANYNRGTFYTHYDNKEALLDDILTPLMEELVASYRAPYGEVDVFHIDELPANAVKIFDHIHLNADVYTALFKSDVLPLVRDKMFSALKHIAMEDLDYPSGELNHELLVIYNMHALIGLVSHWIESGFQYPVTHMRDQLILMINWRPRSVKTQIKRTDKP
ncbi:TetR/AcrR family transcriptional regulator [Paenibacillus glucanolyticus]|jgi:AcrR family transcriptional regulator|uniref:TetR/AcrR family transcriptional regulator n=1 Tax=Paenibacillus TaxID=44249 RepID=UPI0003E1EDCD|nr:MULTISPECIES: TetR/AcrR family transcriptional regulator [Paenibacillus]ANA82582.1 TetR family transcriptional regulator [Paenibacillus glucanolyticus]AVV58677.1 TetR/AcrR family transcriptional regulator [Paenibacillus glucanolyticus]ETT39804.1 TetR family transcriptional regulator [Paenibacillus sp. FSL R5-808]MDH6675103.1 AcrR family transcriptional regulator [Paenibacillus sp. LBL]MPY17363.1 TetR/AcrR family transcriptional regulator [Paenibacillus glucanolyticus]